MSSYKCPECGVVLIDSPSGYVTGCAHHPSGIHPQSDNKSKLLQGLNQFSGSETGYRHSINRYLLYTEGVQYFAETAGAYWFLDIVATEFMRLQRQAPFLSITLKVSGCKAEIVVKDGGKGVPEVVLKSKRIQFTDCPEGDWKFYLVDNVLMLPGEY